MESPLNVAIDLVAYPGAPLITPTDQEREDGVREGMNEIFFDVSVLVYISIQTDRMV